MEMKKYKLGDILVNHDRRRIPLSSKVRSGRKGNFRYYGAQGVVDYIDDYIFDGEYVLIAEDGENLRSRNQNVANLVSGQFWVNNHAHIVTTNEKCDLHYFYYAFNFLQIDGYISGSAQPKLSQDSLNRIEMTIPDLQTQKGIASFLFTIDKRIENLHAQNRMLEQTAKTIYDYTFLQCAGHQTTYNKTLNRNIPTDWEVKEFQNICNIKRGASPRPIDDYMDPTNQGMPWVKISDASKDGSPFMLDVKESIIKDGVSKSVTVTPGTLIVSNSASPGIPKFIQLTACVHDGWLVLDKYDESFKYYLFYVILDMRENLLHIASGSVFKNLKTDYLKQLPVLIPDSKTMENFNAKIKPLFEKQLVNAKQIEALTTQRNTLLPLLMTGQINI